MERTIVAAFDTYHEADDARRELLDNGFSGSDLHISEESATTAGERPAEGGGFLAGLRNLFLGEERDYDYYEEASRRGHALLSVDCPSEEHVDRASDILQRHNPIDLDRRSAEWRQSGWTGQQTRTETEAETTGRRPATRTRARGSEGEESIPVVEEKLRVGKRSEQRGGLRIFSRVTETPVSEDVTLREEKVDVERRRVDRPAGAGDLREQSIEMTETREEPVVSKEARVVEEVILTKGVKERTETVKEKVRKTDVDIQKLEEQDRRDFESRYAGRGYNYEHVQAAYRYGHDLARDPDYRGRSWSEVEPEARRLFEERNPGRWEEFKDAIRNAFEGQRQRRAA